MRGYGLPRLKWLECPDIADIKKYGLASHVGKNKKRGGDYNGYVSSNSKKEARRALKKIARAKTKVEIRKELIDI